jgi:hypothetical protein
MSQHPTRLALVAAAFITLGSLAGGQEPAKADPETGFRRSDPSLLSATGRPQLVEFFHPA